MRHLTTKAILLLLACLMVAAQAFAGTTVSYTQTVNKATPGVGGVPAVTLASSPNPSTYNQSVTFTATVPSQATGTVTFYDGATSIGTGTVSSGTATLAISTLSVGAHTVTASYGGDSNFNSATSTAITQTVNKAASTTTLATAPNPSTYGATVTLTATVTSGATGTVTFYDGATSIGTGTISSGTATLTTSALTAGTHSLTANYGGDGNYLTSTSAAVTQTVNKASSTTTVTSAPNPSAYSTAVTLTATVPANATGTVTFYDGATSIGTGTVSSGTATLNISTLSVGSHSITAQYAGDSNYTGSTSAAITQTVNKGTLVVTLSSSANPSTYGTAITLTANGYGSETGTVTFYDGATSIGTGTISSGKATLSISTLTAGSHSLTAQWAGDANFNAVTSNTVTQVVNKNSSYSITVTSDVNPSTFGATVTLTAHVPSDATGSVTFWDGATQIGSAATISSGTASVTTSTLTVGTHSITVQYGGDSNYASGTSAALSQVVNKATLNATVNGAPNPSTYLQTVTITFQAVAVNGVMPTGTVQFDDGGTAIGTPVAIDATGKATITTSTLAAGSHTINAIYSGDANFN